MSQDKRVFEIADIIFKNTYVDKGGFSGQNEVAGISKAAQILADSEAERVEPLLESCEELLDKFSKQGLDEGYPEITERAIQAIETYAEGEK